MALSTRHIEPLLPSAAPGLQAVDDALTVTDAVNVAVGRFVTVADPLGMTDAAAFDRGVVQADALGVVDTPAPAQGFARTVADPLAITDTPTPLQVIIRQVDDPLSVTETLALSRGVALADALGMGDTVTTAAAVALALADALGLSDSVTAQIVLLVQLADTIQVTDARTLGVGLGLDEQLQLADSFVRASSTVRTIDDLLLLSDEPSFGLVFTFDDALALTDLAATDLARTLLLDLADELGITDDVFSLGAAAAKVTHGARGLVVSGRGGRLANSRGRLGRGSGGQTA